MQTCLLRVCIQFAELAFLLKTTPALCGSPYQTRGASPLCATGQASWAGLFPKTSHHSQKSQAPTQGFLAVLGRSSTCGLYLGGGIPLSPFSAQVVLEAHPPQLADQSLGAGG